MVFKLKYGDQKMFPVWENVILIDADSFEEALLEGRKYGEWDNKVQADSKWTLNDQPADNIFAGIRSIKDVSDVLADLKLFNTESKCLEVTCIQYEVDSINKIDELVKGSAVAVNLDQVYYDVE